MLGHHVAVDLPQADTALFHLGAFFPKHLTNLCQSTLRHCLESCCAGSSYPFHWEQGFALREDALHVPPPRRESIAGAGASCGGSEAYTSAVSSGVYLQINDPQLSGMSKLGYI